MNTAVIDHSLRLKDADAAAAAAAVQAVSIQVREHVAPAWRREPGPVQLVVSEREIPDDSWIIGIFDDGQQATGLGYHALTPQGQPYAKVFVSPVLNNGGKALSGGELTVSMVLSHEVIEMFLDPHLSVWVDDGKGSAWAVEACDPVQFDRYGFAVSGQYRTLWTELIGSASRSAAMIE